MQLRADNRVGAGEGWAPAPACRDCFLQRPDEPVNYPTAVGGRRSFFLSKKTKPGGRAGVAGTTAAAGPHSWLLHSWFPP